MSTRGSETHAGPGAGQEFTICHLAVLDLPRRLESVREARRLLLTCLAAWDSSEGADDLAVVVSELVSNAVLHGGPPLLLQVSCRGGACQVDVSDGLHMLPVLRETRQDLACDLDQATRQSSALDVEALWLDDRDERLDVGQAGTVVGGRGLLLVAALTDSWCSKVLPAGKVVWARRAGTELGGLGRTCPSSDAPDARRVASGATVVDIEAP